VDPDAAKPPPYNAATSTACCAELTACVDISMLLFTCAATHWRRYPAPERARGPVAGICDCSRPVN
jgi:hypothetical protein